MNGLYFVVAIAAVVGFVLYSDSDILPFEFQSPVTVLAPTPEKIQQISDAITSNENEIVYYSFEDVPSIPDKQIPVNALKKAIQSWETSNPNLEFIQSDNANVEIRWQVYASSTHTGLATCNSVLYGILSHCVLDISVGAEDCDGYFIQNDENMVANIMMHEIGHALGLGHTSESGNLMYSTESPQIDFDTKGYTVPDRLEELFVGQNVLVQQEKELTKEIESLDVKISREQSQYDEYHKQYEYYEGKTLSQEDYQKSQQVFNKLNSQGEKVNVLINKQNELIDEINIIVQQLGCNPNFELKS